MRSDFHIQQLCPNPASSLPKGLCAVGGIWGDGDRSPPTHTAWGTPTTVLGFAGAAPSPCRAWQPLDSGAKAFWGGGRIGVGVSPVLAGQCLYLTPLRAARPQPALAGPLPWGGVELLKAIRAVAPPWP